MRAHISVIIVILALLLLAMPAVAADWPMAKKDATHTSYADDQLSPPLEPAWTIGVGGGIVASPVISDGVLYFSNDTGKTITAMNVSTGTVVFMRAAGGPIESTPAVADSTIIFGAYDGNVYCVKRSDGSLLWQTPLNSGIYSSPLVYQGLVYIGTDERRLLCPRPGERQSRMDASEKPDPGLACRRRRQGVHRHA